MALASTSIHEVALAQATEVLWAAMGGTEEGWVRMSYANRKRYQRYLEPAIRSYVRSRYGESLASGIGQG